MTGMPISNKANNIEGFLPYSLIAMDMDGTLLTSDKKILSETLDDLAWVADKGAYLSYATGRALVEMNDFFEITPYGTEA